MAKCSVCVALMGALGAGLAFGLSLSLPSQQQILCVCVCSWCVVYIHGRLYELHMHTDTCLRYGFRLAY